MRASTAPTDGTKAGRWPRDQPRKTEARPDRAPRQRHQSREPDYPRKSNLPGIQGKVCSARDPSPQQSASSDPSANRAAIIPRESHRPARFYTARVMPGRAQTHKPGLVFDDPNRTKLFHVKHFGTIWAKNLTRPKTAVP